MRAAHRSADVRTFPRVAPARYMVEVTRPDGSVDRTVAEGGHSCDHTMDAMERAGLGGVVRVTRLPVHLAEAA